MRRGKAKAALHMTVGLAEDAMMEQLFQIVGSLFDANRDEWMDAGEMKLYLVAVGAWGSDQGLGGIVTLHRHPSASYQIGEDSRCLDS
jgi:hypothetical protein